MARSEQVLQDGVRLNDLISMGILAQSLPMPVVEAALASHQKQTLRQRKLPREFLVYYVVAMALFSGVNTIEVLKAILEGLASILPNACKEAAGDSAISQARTELGAGVMEGLATTICQPMAEPGTPGAWYHDWRLVSIDGSCFDLADEKALITAFPKHHNGKEYPFPQLRFAALVELGTRCMFAVAQGNDQDSEKQLADRIIPCLQPGMLVLGDRYYMGYDTFSKVVATGADLLFRAKANLTLKPIEHLPDGSYLAKIYRDRKDRRQDGGHLVRVIAYQVTENGTTKPERYRLVTTILDWAKAPAVELAGLYRQRWGIETTFDELKSHLKLPGHTLRSKRPDLVKQEFWGFVLAHYIVRHVMYQAAKANNLDPGDISFQSTISIIKRKSASARPFPPPAKGMPATSG